METLMEVNKINPMAIPLAVIGVTAMTLMAIQALCKFLDKQR